MDKILAKAQELAARQEQIEAERQTAKLEKEYKDIQLQLKAALGDDAEEILAAGQPYFTQWRGNVYLQCGDWLFDKGGWYEKPTCAVRHIDIKDRYSTNWSQFSDLVGLGRAIKHNLEEVVRLKNVEQSQEEREQAYFNANPDGWAIGYLKRLVVDINRYNADYTDKLTAGQRLIVALVQYLSSREDIPDWEEPESDSDDSEDEE